MFLREKSERRDCGIWTTNENKIRYASDAREELSTDSVSFLEDMVCKNPFLDPDKRIKITQKKFIEQMKRFKLVNPEIRNAGNIPKATVSGKVNDDGKINTSFNDDLYFVFTMGMSLLKSLYRREVKIIDYDRLFSRK